VGVVDDFRYPLFRCSAETQGQEWCCTRCTVDMGWMGFRVCLIQYFLGGELSMMVIKSYKVLFGEAG
jgi:hypothetical protein